MSIWSTPTAMRSIKAVRTARWRIIGSSGQRFPISWARGKPSGITDRGADLDIQLLCFCQSAPQDAIGFFQGETHRSFPPLGTLMLRRRRDCSATRHRAPLPVRLNRAARAREESGCGPLSQLVLTRIGNAAGGYKIFMVVEDRI